MMSANGLLVPKCYAARSLISLIPQYQLLSVGEAGAPSPVGTDAQHIGDHLCDLTPLAGV